MIAKITATSGGGSSITATKVNSYLPSFEKKVYPYNCKKVFVSFLKYS